MDTIGDFLTRIRNAGIARHEKVDIPASKIREGIVRILKEKGYVRDYRVAKDSRQGVMRVYLKYDSEGTHVIEHVRRVSRPGRRVYKKSTEIPQVRSGYGFSILSTNKGILSNEEASAQNVGGEVLCLVW